MNRATEEAEEFREVSATKNDAHNCPVSVVFNNPLTIPLGSFVHIVSLRRTSSQQAYSGSEGRFPRTKVNPNWFTRTVPLNQKA